MTADVIEIIRTTAVLGLAAVAAVSDLRTRTIPNRWTLSALGVGLLLAGVSGLKPLLLAAAGAGLAAAVFVPLWALRALGAGDVKLLMAMGALLGPRGLVVGLLWTALAGGALAVYAAAQRGALLAMVKDTGALALHLVTLGTRGRRRTLDTLGTLMVPYGIAIAIGAVLARIGGLQ